MVLEKMPHSLEVAANPPSEDFEHPNIVSPGGGEEAGGRRGGQEDIRSDKRYRLRYAGLLRLKMKLRGEKCIYSLM